MDVEKINGLETARTPEVINDSKVVFVSELAQVLFGLAIIGILAHDLSLERFGIWFSTIAIFQLFMFADFGFSTIVARKVPDSSISNKKIMSVVRRTQIIIVTLLVPICYLVLSSVFGDSEISNPPIYLLAISTIAISCSNVNRSYLRTVGLSFREVHISLMDRGVTLLALFVARNLFDATEFSYIIAFISGPLIGYLYSFALVNREFGEIEEADQFFSSKELLSESIPFALDSILAPISESLTRIILLFFSGASSVAIFEIAWKVFVGGGAIVRSIRKSMLSSFSSNQFADNHLSISLLDSSRIVHWLAPIGLISGTCGAFLIPLVFSTEYQESIPVFLLLLGTWTIMLIGSPNQVAVQTLQSGKRYLALTGFGTVIQLAVAIPFVENWGPIGASLSVLIGQLVMVSCSIYFTISIEYFRVSISKIAFSLLMTIIFTALAWAIEPQRVDSSLIAYSACISLAMMFSSGWRPRPPSVETRDYPHLSR